MKVKLYRNKDCNNSTHQATFSNYFKNGEKYKIAFSVKHHPSMPLRFQGGQKFFKTENELNKFLQDQEFVEVK